MRRYYNDFDEALEVCHDCEEIVNDGIADDRQRFRPLTVSDETVCSLCGEPKYRHLDQPETSYKIFAVCVLLALVTR